MSKNRQKSIKPDVSDLTDPTPQGDLSEEQMEAIRQERFNRRLQRVLAVMREERIDWMGIPYFTQDGRLLVQVRPVEMRTS